MQLGECGHAGKKRQCAGGVIAALIVVVGHAQPDLAADFDADNVSLDEIQATHRFAVHTGEQRADDYHARMRGHHRQHVVVIQ